MPLQAEGPEGWKTFPVLPLWELEKRSIENMSEDRRKNVSLYEKLSPKKLSWPAKWKLTLPRCLISHLSLLLSCFASPQFHICSHCSSPRAVDRLIDVHTSGAPNQSHLMQVSQHGGAMAQNTYVTLNSRRLVFLRVYMPAS